MTDEGQIDNTTHYEKDSRGSIVWRNGDTVFFGTRSTPTDSEYSAGQVALYFKSDDNLYKRPHGGSESQVGGGALSDSGNDTDGGDDYQLPQAADNIDLQGSGGVRNADVVDAEEARFGAVNGQGDVFRLIERQTLGSDSGKIQFTGLRNDAEYKIWLNCQIETSGGDVYLRVNGDGGSTGAYDYWDASATKQSGENEFLIATLSNNGQFATNIRVTDGRFGISARKGFRNDIIPARSENITDFGREGGRNTFGNSLSSIELISDDVFLSSGTVAELWERDYS